MFCVFILLPYLRPKFNNFRGLEDLKLNEGCQTDNSQHPAPSSSFLPCTSTHSTTRYPPTTLNLGFVARCAQAHERKFEIHFRFDPHIQRFRQNNPRSTRAQIAFVPLRGQPYQHTGRNQSFIRSKQRV